MDKKLKDLIENTAMYKLFDKHYPNGAWLESNQLIEKIIKEVEKGKNNG